MTRIKALAKAKVWLRAWQRRGQKYGGGLGAGQAQFCGKPLLLLALPMAAGQRGRYESLLVSSIYHMTQAADVKNANRSAHWAIYIHTPRVLKAWQATGELKS